MLEPATLFRRRLRDWYARHRRILPWRTSGHARPDPYHVLVSEAMLQQTQVATVIGYFNRFIACFPTLLDLAAAQPQQVLRMWQGLGYYSRARCLQATAKIVAQQFSGQVPSTIEELLTLPGVGRYTAGAIASLAYDRRAPILDGNVIRVLCRLDGIRQDPRRPEIKSMLWKRAEEILPRKNVGDFNSALMELGALICVPANPRCQACPVQSHCSAFAAGIAPLIPPPKQPKHRPLERRWTICIRHADRYLIQQRPPTGRWAGMWQFLTIPADDAIPADTVPATITAALGLPLTGLRHLGTVTHNLTHRRYQFDVFAARLLGRHTLRDEQRWVTLPELDAYPLSRPQLQVADMVRQEDQDRSHFHSGPAT